MARTDEPPNVARSQQSPRLIFGTGEMADRTRSFNWSTTPVGPIEHWPDTLLVTVNTMLATRHPMFLWWGRELIQFYNDGYRPSIGADKHPQALGQRGRDCWPEIWHIIGPQIDDVMSRGQSTWHEDQLVPIYRDGRLEDVYWTYSYSPVRDPEGTIHGTLVTCSETTGRVVAEQALRRSEVRLRLTQRAARLAAWELDLEAGEYTWSEEALAMLGHPDLGRTQADLLSLMYYSGDRQAAQETFKAATTKGKEFETQFRILWPDGQARWIAARGTPFYNRGKGLVLGVFIDITDAEKTISPELGAKVSTIGKVKRPRIKSGGK